MCGIFAYAGEAAPDPDLLAAAAVAASQRGPHAHGWLARDQYQGRMHHELGPWADCAQCHEQLPGTPRILGHSRLATMGAQPHDPSGIQPLTCGGHWLAHNGNVYNAAQMAPNAVTDSAALIAAYALSRSNGCTPSEALSRVVALAEQTAWAIVVLDVTGALVAHRGRLPLYHAHHQGGVYLSSVEFPGATPVPAGQLILEAPPL